MSSGEFVNPQVYTNDLMPDEVDEDPPAVALLRTDEPLRLLVEQWLELSAELSKVDPGASAALRVCARQVTRIIGE